MLLKYSLDGPASLLRFSGAVALLGFVAQVEASLEIIRQSQQFLSGFENLFEMPARANAMALAA